MYISLHIAIISRSYRVHITCISHKYVELVLRLEQFNTCYLSRIYLVHIAVYLVYIAYIALYIAVISRKSHKNLELVLRFFNPYLAQCAKISAYNFGTTYIIVHRDNVVPVIIPVIY